MNDFIRKITSRKFIMALAGFVSGLLIFFGYPEQEAAQVAALIVAGMSIFSYCVGEGMADGGNHLTIEPTKED